MIRTVLNLIEFLLDKSSTRHGGRKSSKQENAIRKLISFIYGSLIGLIFYHSIIRNIGFSEKHQPLTIAIACSFCALMCVISIQFRCISVLIWLEMLSRGGRSLIKAVIIALLLLGPVENILRNSMEVTRVFECTTLLTYRLARNKFDLAFLPFIHAFTHMEGDLSAVQESLNEITRVVGPIVEEIEGEDNFTRRARQLTGAPDAYARKYEQKLRKRCEQQFERGSTNCERAFQRVYDDCFEKAPPIANYIVCSPLKIDFVCSFDDVVEGVGVNLCDTSNVIDADFGSEYSGLREKQRKFTSDYSSISFDYEAGNVSDFSAALNETSKELSQNLNETVDLMDYIVRFCRKLMILIYFKIIYDAIIYHDNFLRNISFNNYYITDYFRKIDRRRVRVGVRRVLPIRSIEVDKVVDVKENKKLRKEFQGYFGLTLNLILQVVSSTLFIALDRLFYELLDMIARHSRVRYEQEGLHMLNVTVNGTGFIANLIRASVDGFNVNKHVDIAMTNEACLPQPTTLDTAIIVEIYLLFLLNLYLIYNQVYIHRFKRSVCAFFYPKREKRRIFYLYDKTLKRRRQLFAGIVQTLRYRLKVRGVIESDRNIFQTTLSKFPRLCKCLRLLSLARPKCFICQVVQTRKWTKDSLLFWQCSDKSCQVVYCEQCWMEIGRKCLVCRIRRHPELNIADEEIF